MKKINIKKDIIPMATHALAAGAGGATAAGVNELTGKVDFLASLPTWVMPLAKMGIGVILPRVVGKKNKSLQAHADSFGKGMIGVAGVEMANATGLLPKPLAISGVIPTLGYIERRIPTLGNTSEYPFDIPE